MSGAVRIFFYNWPIYLGTWAAAAAVIVVGVHLGAMLLVLGATAAALWSVWSLAVSFYIYDRSALAGGTWVGKLVPAGTEAWATIDAGLDAEVDLDASMPGHCIARLDIYDGNVVGRGSVERARARTPRQHVAKRCSATALALPDASCDVVAVVFTAHEVQTADDRDRFFREIGRTLRVGGRVVLVEHHRDLPNFLAFGPGFFHFLPRGEWLRVARAAGMIVRESMHVTPWVTALALERAT